MSKIYKTFAVETKEVDADQGIFEAMISTESVDRDGDIVVADGVELENFRKNPVVLADHRYLTDSVIGKSIKEEIIPGKGIKSTFQFIEKGINAKADMVREMFRLKFLNAVSIGFSVSESEKRTNEEGDDIRGRIFKIWELLEFSIVAVPANPEALQLAIKGMEGEALTVEDVYKSFTHITGEHEGEVLTVQSKEIEYLKFAKELTLECTEYERIEILMLAKTLRETYEDLITIEDLKKALDRLSQDELSELLKSNTDDDTEHPDEEALKDLSDELKELNQTIRN